MPAFAKRTLTRYPWLKAGAYVAHDVQSGLRQRFHIVSNASGSTHLALSADESIAYVERVFESYKRYVTVEHFYGAAAELGPGDNAGVALLMRADGCETVDLIDRFRSGRNEAQQRAIYQALSHRHHLEDFRLSDDWDEQRLSGIHWRLGMPAEDFLAEGGRSYDLIVSTAVLEHLFDPIAALTSMVRCLRPGAHMVHVIDFRDHEMFTPIQPELTSLRFPGWLYRRMTHHSGRPNRVLVHRYRKWVEQSEPTMVYKILVERLAGVGPISPPVEFERLPTDAIQRAVAYVEQHRRGFAAEFSAVSSGDLAVTGIVLVGERVRRATA